MADTGWIAGQKIAWSSHRVIWVRERPHGWTSRSRLWRVMSPTLGLVDGLSRVAADRVAADRVASQSAAMARATRMRGAGVMAEAADLNGQQDRQNGHQK